MAEMQSQNPSAITCQQVSFILAFFLIYLIVFMSRYLLIEIGQNKGCTEEEVLAQIFADYTGSPSNIGSNNWQILAVAPKGFIIVS